MENFINDAEKMHDFKCLTKFDFLKSYSYLTEEEYDATKNIVADLRTCADCGKQTHVYDCFEVKEQLTIISDYYCSECSPNKYGEEVEE